jgi:hypothetical protein
MDETNSPFNHKNPIYVLQDDDNWKQVHAKSFQEILKGRQIGT